MEDAVEQSSLFAPSDHLISEAAGYVVCPMPCSLFPKRARLSTFTPAVSHGKDIQGRGAVGSDNAVSSL